MSAKDARGTKRTCQNPECESRFYDLNRNPIQCPLCGSGYVIASAPISAATEKMAARRMMTPPKAVEQPVAAPDSDTETDEAEALPETIDVSDAPVAEADEIVLEEDDDSGDVSGILDGPVAPTERDV